MKQTILVVGLLALLASSAAAQAEDRLAMSLEDHFAAAAAAERTDRLVAGGIAIGLSAVLTAGGAVFWFGGFEQRLFGDYFSGVLGPAFTIGGAVALGITIPATFIPTKTERAYRAYSALSDDVVRRGERLFLEAAESQKLFRLIGSVSNMALGGAQLGVGILYGQPAVFSTAAMSLGVGVAGLLVKGKTEREWARYEAEKQHILRE